MKVCKQPGSSWSTNKWIRNRANRLSISLCVCVHTCNALINHQGSVGALGYLHGESGCLTKQSVWHREGERGGGGAAWKGGVKEWLNTKNTEQRRCGRMRTGDWMLKRDCSKEDFKLGGRNKSNWAGKSVVMQLLSSKQEKEREGGEVKEIDFHDYWPIKTCSESVCFLTFPDIKRIWTSKFETGDGSLKGSREKMTYTKLPQLLGHLSWILMTSHSHSTVGCFIELAHPVQLAGSSAL